MVSEDLSIVRKVVSLAREFCVESVYGVSDSLKECNDSGFNPLYIPELAKIRADGDKDSRVWQKWYLAPSVRVTGRTKSGTPVVVYAHVPTSLSDPSNIRKLINEKALVNDAGPMPQDEFYSLLDQEGNGKVFVVDYNTLRESTLGLIRVDDALAHTQTVPFLGGEEIAQAYLRTHQKVFGENIGIWHNDDLGDEPLGRLLCVGNNDFIGLVDGNILDGGRFLGVAPTSAPLEERV